MMQTLSAHLEGGRGNPNNKGHQRPQSHAVFLCLSKLKTVSVRLHSVMAGCIGLPSGRPSLCSVFPHPIQSAANVVENISSGLNPQNKGITAMNTSSLPGESCPQLHDLNEFEQAALAVFGSNTALFFTPGKIPHPDSLKKVIDRCKRLLSISEKLLEVCHD